jgi:DNA-binding transcriptional regulator YhcF (GntR family)
VIDAPRTGPRRPTAALAVFYVDARDPAPAYVQLERRVRVAVADGMLSPGKALPSVRKLAGDLGISPNTVGRANADLSRERGDRG